MSTVIALCLCFCVAPTLLAASAAPVCWLVVPSDGRPGAIYRHAPSVLKQAGLTVTLSRPDGSPSVVVVYPRALQDGSALDEVLQASNAGAGLVVIFSSDLSTFEQKLIDYWGAKISQAEATTARLEIIDHPITRGLGDIFVWRVPATISGLRPLMRQGNNVIAACGTRDGRRLVLLPLDALVPGQGSDAIPQPNLRLLAQSALWAATGQAATTEALEEKPPPETPAESATPPVQRGSFRRLACVDMAAEDEDWPAIREAVGKLLERQSFEVQPVRVPKPKAEGRSPRQETPGEAPLVRALKDDPALLVLGSCRPLGSAEQIAVIQYVEAGGSLLALPRATNRTNERLVWLNELLVDFGVVATLARDGGPAVARPRTPAAELGEFGEIPAGIRVVGLLAVPWVLVNEQIVAAVQSYGSGRIAVADPVPLFSAKAPKTAELWSRLISRMVEFLVEGIDLK
ncbi:MAG: hypothetical protein H5T86_08665 [Armatimonadetes bacterium]|nr:hypothetical protein [Armatimonadota bacterium]